MNLSSNDETIGHNNLLKLTVLLKGLNLIAWKSFPAFN